MAKPRRAERPHDPNRARDIKTAFSKAENSARSRVLRMAKRSDNDNLFFFMVDASSAMANGGNRQAVEGLLMAQRVGPATSSALWSDKKVEWLPKDVLKLVEGYSIRKHFLSQPMLCPAVAEMARLAEATDFIGKTPHFAILTTGQIADADKAREDLKALLQKHPEASVDFVVYPLSSNPRASGYTKPEDSAAWRMADALAADFGDRIHRRVSERSGWHDLAGTVHLRSSPSLMGIGKEARRKNGGPSM